MPYKLINQNCLYCSNNITFDFLQAALYMNLYMFDSMYIRGQY